MAEILGNMLVDKKKSHYMLNKLENKTNENSKGIVGESTDKEEVPRKQSITLLENDSKCNLAWAITDVINSDSTRKNQLPQRF